VEKNETYKVQFSMLYSEFCKEKGFLLYFEKGRVKGSSQKKERIT